MINAVLIYVITHNRCTNIHSQVLATARGPDSMTYAGGGGVRDRKRERETSELLLCLTFSSNWVRTKTGTAAFALNIYLE